jgi:PLAT/LH2 domain
MSLKTDQQAPARPMDPQVQPLTRGYPEMHENGASLAPTNYLVSVYTGDVPGAGTDGDVWVWFDGTAGRSGPPWRYIDNGNDNFERNVTDYFTLTLPNIGTPIACWVYFRPSGSAPDWYLSTITVNDKVFSYYTWITQEGMYRLTTT